MYEILLLVSAIGAGFLGALLGLGGGIIVVPVLTLLYHVNIRYAIAASLISIVATSSGAAAFECDFVALSADCPLAGPSTRPVQAERRMLKLATTTDALRSADRLRFWKTGTSIPALIMVGIGLTRPYSGEQS